jgi:hypothetical protein
VYQFDAGLAQVYHEEGYKEDVSEAKLPQSRAKVLMSVMCCGFPLLEQILHMLMDLVYSHSLLPLFFRPLHYGETACHQAQ